MLASVFVAYSSRSGSTAEVAQAIGDSMRKWGLAVDIAPIGQVVSIPRMTAVVLGAPLYVGRFPKEFHRFLARHRVALEILKPWCFVLGPTRTNPGDFEAARHQAIRQLDRYKWFCPADVRVFGGRWDPKHLPFPFSLAARLPGGVLDKIPAADVRDWAEIDTWAAGIARQIKSAA
jgi:menaquinone-dependent protoporphyrinogen oxidase